ncbi:MAG: hypothetical protein KGR48_15545 [Alphaproteobacteria bacterium]|nr:hypothetical protein [Alphaproteobacteria bacterium]MBU6471022.1 hypothetical protein [Alphaproteobacteria bacterium]MDE2012214.1 hypothetical protein [Alphaproteobacteria bacterium]MDE2074859.1 hypothetical protein [Alphaproteobacteria bacterium]MDE2351483.1 hypothetical protein [Alphaproteobacteria bacterium]
MTALKREWLAARLVLIVGFAIAIAFGGYRAYVWRSSIVQQRAQVAAQVGAEQGGVSGADEGDASSSSGALVCHQALAIAVNFGVLPEEAKLTDSQPKPTSVSGRYSCGAATQSAKFTIAIDLVCRNLQDQRCVALYNVTQDGGAVLFQRQD